MSEAGLIVARVATYVAMMLAAGIPLYLVCARPVADPAGRFLRLSGVAALGAIAASFWWVVASVAAMAALPVAQLDQATLMAVLGATPLGNVLVVRVIALIMAALAAWRGRIFLTALSASLGLASLAWTGHAGASEAALGTLHRASDVIHLLAAATWMGALILFLTTAISGDRRQGLARHLSRFATTGSVIVTLLLVTGAANTMFIAGLQPDLTQPWSLLLIAKIALFSLMLLLAAFNRWRLAPALSRDPNASQRALLLSLALETTLAFAIVALVGIIGTLSPAI